MKKQNKYSSFCDEICGKECSDYIGEFTPHRLSLFRFEEDSDEFFDADEDKIFREP